ncbi:MAG: DUF3375 domain-containing protein [Proteobacteria bacterium]|nr:DUF3375 domain-containing protein [Pseudomonadota bacterium]
MDYEYFINLQQSNVGIGLLKARNLPLIASFLWQQFIQQNQRVWRADDLTEQLDNQLFDLRRRFDDESFPRTGSNYLDDWSDKQQLLRKYYVAGDDIPRFELSPVVEKTLAWLESLQGRSFVGTESHLKTVFDLLRALVQQTETNANERVKRLQQQKQAIELEIQQTLAGDFPLLDDTQVRERFSQLQDSAQALLRDFSEVEQNFRELDQQTRKRIAQHDGHRGTVLDDIFNDANSIRNTDQGRSFTAFWEFLMSLSHQQELDELLGQVQQLNTMKASRHDPTLGDLKLKLMEAADKVMQTNRQLADQLRRFLDDRARLDNRRISQLVQTARQQLLILKEQDLTPDTVDFMPLEDTRLVINTPAPVLYRIPLTVNGQNVLQEANHTLADATELFKQIYIDEAKLTRQIHQCLETQAAVSLPEVLERFPPRNGIAELVAYVKLASETQHTLIENEQEDTIKLERLR